MVKIGTSSKAGALIRHREELEFYFKELVSNDRVLVWRFPADGAEITKDQIELSFDRRTYAFTPVYELKPSLPWLETLKSSRGKTVLLVSPELSDRVFERCRDLGFSALDLNGRAWLRGPGLLIERASIPGRAFRYELEPKNIFTGKSARIVRYLLTDRDRAWNRTEIGAQVEASAGLVSRIIQYLLGQGFLQRVGSREFQVSDPLALLDTWAETDFLNKRTTVTRYAGFLGTPLELARRLQDYATKYDVRIAFTQWIAAWVRCPCTEPSVVSAYASRRLERRFLEELGLRPVPEGGKLWVYLSEDDGALRETQPCAGLTFVTDAQIVLDLQRTGLRGPEAAAALREWDGFCRPRHDAPFAM